MNFNFPNTNDDSISSEISITRKEIKSALFLEKVEDIIAQNYQDEQFGLPELCVQLCLSRTQVYRKLISFTGIGPAQQIKEFRLLEAQTLLQSTDLTITEIAYAVGFRDASYFSKVYKEHFGYLPSET